MNRIVRITILMLVVFIFGTINSYAANNSVTLIPNTTNIKKGEIFTVVVKAESENGIDGIDGTLKYDAQKLEFVNEAEITEDGLSQRTTDDVPGSFQLTILSNGKTSVSKELKFKALDAAEINEQLSIELVNIDLEDSEESDQKIENQIIKLTIVKDEENDNNQSEDNKDDTENQGDNKEADNKDNKQNDSNANKDNENNKSKDPTTNPEKIGKLGLERYIYAILGVSIAMTIVFLMKCKEYKNI